VVLGVGSSGELAARWTNWVGRGPVHPYEGALSALPMFATEAVVADDHHAVALAATMGVRRHLRSRIGGKRLVVVGLEIGGLGQAVEKGPS
jgi:hypothetical protein